MKGVKMPRVTINKKKYMIADLPGWIAGRMHKLKIKQVNMAKELGITQATLSIRLNNDSDTFTYGDLITLFKELEATDEEILKLMRL